MTLAFRFAALGLFLLSPLASSATFCISDVGGLANALATAQNNAETDNVIQLQSGFYALDASNARLSYAPATPKNLTIQGGYSLFGCGQVETESAKSTVIDGSNGTHTQSAFSLDAMSGSIALQSIAVANMVNTNVNGDPAVYVHSHSGGDVSLNNVELRDNVGAFTTNFALEFGSFGGRIFIRNSVIAGNLALNANGGAVLFRAENGNQSGFCTLVTNSTFSGNSAGSIGMQISHDNPQCNSIMANSVVSGNEGAFTGFRLYAQEFLFWNDVIDLGSYIEIYPASFTEVYDVDPMFVDALGGDYSLRDDSPLRDTGSDLDFLGGPGPTDVLGRTRTYGTHPDIGAYEVQDVIFANGFNEWLQ